ncbi:hypothetical protein CUAC110533_04470 [Cutibacterium acnes subsp. elongatum]
MSIAVQNMSGPAVDGGMNIAALLIGPVSGPPTISVGTVRRW